MMDRKVYRVHIEALSHDGKDSLIRNLDDISGLAKPIPNFKNAISVVVFWDSKEDFTEYLLNCLPYWAEKQNKPELASFASKCQIEDITGFDLCIP